jgi:3-deoxy-7-phosphoheptulonate synthase
MQNFELLKDLGRRTTKPIMLKRGFANTIEEWIMCAEYIVNSGNPNVIFCERGIRTFETQTRNTLDPSVVAIIKQKTHLPVIIDPSHAAGTYKLVEPSSLAAIATKADGLMIESHDDPENALSDGPQCIKPERLRAIIEKGKRIAEVVGREM